MDIVYGVYFQDNKDRVIYECALSIKSICHYNNDISIYVYTNDVKVKELLDSLIGDIKVNYIFSTEFVDILYKIVTEKDYHNSTKWCTRGIFYRLQALTEFEDFYYLDTDVICTGKITRPKGKSNIFKQKWQSSSCVMYSKTLHDKKKLLDFIAEYSRDVQNMYVPDEQIIRRFYKDEIEDIEFPVLHHCGRNIYETKVEGFNRVYFNELCDYIDSLKDTDKPQLAMFDNYFKTLKEKYMNGLALYVRAGGLAKDYHPSWD